jgi:hypothetical protein
MGTIKWIVAATAAVLFCAVIGVTAHAASLTVGAPSATQTSSLVEKAARCWRRNGRRYCAPVARTNRGYGYENRGYGYDLSYGRLRAEELPLGTSAWWRAIDHEGHDGGSQ